MMLRGLYLQWKNVRKTILSMNMKFLHLAYSPNMQIIHGGIFTMVLGSLFQMKMGTLFIYRHSLK